MCIIISLWKRDLLNGSRMYSIEINQIIEQFLGSSFNTNVQLISEAIMQFITNKKGLYSSYQFSDLNTIVSMIENNSKFLLRIKWKNNFNIKNRS